MSEDHYDVVEIAPGVFSVLVNGRSYRAVLRESEVLVNGVAFPSTDERSGSRRKRASGGEGKQQILASMPGKVIRVLVETGADVAIGQGLVVVEAMKMQNEVKAARAGRVKEIRVKDGGTVTAGEVLLVIE